MKDGISTYELDYELRKGVSMKPASENCPATKQFVRLLDHDAWVAELESSLNRLRKVVLRHSNEKADLAAKLADYEDRYGSL